MIYNQESKEALKKNIGNKNKNFSFNTNNNYNKKKKNLNIKINFWKCQNCSNINKDKYLYCKICKKSKNIQLNKIKTPENDKKMTIIIENRPNYSFINNLNLSENIELLRKEGLIGFNSSKEFRKSKIIQNIFKKGNE